MKTVLIEFERATSDLSRLLTRSAFEDELLSANLTEVTPETLRVTIQNFKAAVQPFALRQAQYSMQLVLLYGAFERAIENFVSGTMGALNSLIPAYALLPQRIQENHRRKSLDALRDEAWLSRRNDPQISARMIENLHSCESRASNYKLNDLVYSRHTANFRRGLIDEAFRDVGIDGFLALVVEAAEFRAYLRSGSREKGLFDESLGAIDDLAERRNEIAHGNPSQLLTREQLAAYVHFFEVFVRSMYATLRRHLAQYIAGYHATALGKFDKVHYNHVVLLDLTVLPEGTWIEIGDVLAVDADVKLGYDMARIKTIRTDSGDVEGLRSQHGTTVAIGVDARLRANRKIFLVNRDCPASWLLP